MNIRRSLAALRLPASIVIGLLAVSSAMGQSGTPAAPIALKLTATENAMTVSTTNSTTWDSLIVSHRAVSPLGEVHLAALAADKGQMDVLKAIGARLWTDQTTFITLPEGGIYWAFAHNEAGWASARIELPLPEGRLAVWRDAATNHLLVRISVPSQVVASTKLALLLDNVQISEQAISGYAMSGTGYDASNLSSDSKTLWLSIPVTPEAKGTLKAIFELTPKPIELEVLRPTTSAVLAGASHLLERLTKEKGNPLLNVSTTGTPITYAPATQLGYWKSLVETIPTWQGYGELFEKLLTKKKGTHTTWDGTEAELTASDLSSAMSAVAASALTPRLSQQNLTGPVYYGAYTRAMLDNDLHFPLKEGEVLQVLWQGSVDLYYYEPNPTDPNSHDSVMTKLSLPNNPDGTAPKDPYGTVKQLLLTKGTSSDLYAKIANNGLWVKGVRGEHQFFLLDIIKSNTSLHASGVVEESDKITLVEMSNCAIDFSILNNDAVGDIEIEDTVIIAPATKSEFSFSLPVGWSGRRGDNLDPSYSDQDLLGAVSVKISDNSGASAIQEKVLEFTRDVGGERVSVYSPTIYRMPDAGNLSCQDVSVLIPGIVCREAQNDNIASMNRVIQMDPIDPITAVASNPQVTESDLSLIERFSGFARRIWVSGKSNATPQTFEVGQLPFSIGLLSKMGKDWSLRLPSHQTNLYLISRAVYRMELFRRGVTGVEMALSAGSHVRKSKTQGFGLPLNEPFIVYCSPNLSVCEIDFIVGFTDKTSRRIHAVVINGGYDAARLSDVWKNVISGTVNVSVNAIESSHLKDFEKSGNSFAELGVYKEEIIKSKNDIFKVAYKGADWAQRQSSEWAKEKQKQFPECYKDGELIPGVKCDDPKNQLEKEFGGWVVVINGVAVFVPVEGNHGYVPGIHENGTPTLGNLVAHIHSHPPKRNQNFFSNDLVYATFGHVGDYNSFVSFKPLLRSADWTGFRSYLAAPKLSINKKSGRILAIEPKSLDQFYSKWRAIQSSCSLADGYITSEDKKLILPRYAKENGGIDQQAPHIFDPIPGEIQYDWVECLRE